MKPGPMPKSPDRRQRRNRTALSVVPVTPRVVPKAPDGLLQGMQEKWRIYWTSDIASLVTDLDRVTEVERLFRYYALHEQLYKSFKKKPAVTGSTGQPVLSKTFDGLMKLEAVMLALEDRLGIGLKARLKLGITFSDAHRSLEELSRSLDDTDEDEDDPASALLQSSPDGRRSAVAVPRPEGGKVD